LLHINLQNKKKDKSLHKHYIFQLGIPTANIPIGGLDIAGQSDLESGVYFGYCSLAQPTSSSTSTTTTTTDSTPPNTQTTVLSSTPQIYEMVMSVGWNPFYKNTVRSVEVHILHDFGGDFYGAHLKLLILGFVRPELDYVSKEALIEDIKTDIDVSRKSLDRESWRKYEGDGWLRE
jgi:riboflavin kinase